MAHITLSTGTRASIATPSSGDASGAVVLWPDIFGLRPLFEGHAQRLADDHRWKVCVIEMFPGQETLPMADRHGAAASFNDADKLADLEAALDAMGVESAGVLGFCMGGMYAMKALASPRVTRAAAFYGMVRVPDGWAGAGQGDAIDVVRTRPHDLLALFGTDDPWCPLDEIAELEATGANVVRYEGADHGWAQDPDRENYRPVDAADGWARAERFLSGE